MITVVKPGLLTTIQDLGRYGFQKYGVVVSGAMDTFSFRIANLLVGNEENSPAIEMTLIGPSLHFHEDSLIAICGGDLAPSVEGEPIEMWRPIFIKKGSILKFNAGKQGCRAYLAVAGGFSVASIMGSTSTYVRGKMGGVDGRALKANDRLLLQSPSQIAKGILKELLMNESTAVNWKIPYKYKSDPIIRVLKSRQYHLFREDSQESFFQKSFNITTDADRMGYRLNGPLLLLEKKEEMISEGTVVGTVQVTPDGNTVILLSDHQTTGGYPKIAQVITVDLPLLAQLKPGDRIEFKEVTLEEAHRLLLEKEQYINELKIGIQLKYR